MVGTRSNGGWLSTALDRWRIPNVPSTEHPGCFHEFLAQDTGIGPVSPSAQGLDRTRELDQADWEEVRRHAGVAQSWRRLRCGRLTKISDSGRDGTELN